MDAFCFCDTECFSCCTGCDCSAGKLFSVCLDCDVTVAVASADRVSSIFRC
ncbi:hypothetical protein DPMN_117549 [Dreissena polymorpha]|uniref:Uncharacterized protein n=1 Tax=Dreissena polymorpha TaxID=45954 RepID=A0A9D4KQT9_DREPO|nr:hypothetical protein DPMN_117549 [Dreissena polymorpha]